MRISVTGYTGSGKTYTAEMISKKLSIPHIHLDRFWFEAGGLKINRKTSDEDKDRIRAHVRAKALEAIAVDSWVSDGFYSRIQPEISERADLVLFLDIPLWRRLLNHARRIFKRSNRHKELTFWNELTFFYEILRRYFTYRPKFVNFFSEYGYKVTVLRSRKETKRYIENLS